MLAYDERNLIYWNLLDRLNTINPDWRFCFISKEGSTLLVYKPKDGSLIEEPNPKLEARISVLFYNEFPSYIEALQGISLSPNYDNFAEDNEIMYLKPTGREIINRTK